MFFVRERRNPRSQTVLGVTRLHDRGGANGAFAPFFGKFQFFDAKKRGPQFFLNYVRSSSTPHPYPRKRFCGTHGHVPFPQVIVDGVAVKILGVVLFGRQTGVARGIVVLPVVGRRDARGGRSGGGSRARRSVGSLQGEHDAVVGRSGRLENGGGSSADCFRQQQRQQAVVQLSSLRNGLAVIRKPANGERARALRHEISRCNENAQCNNIHNCRAVGRGPRSLSLGVSGGRHAVCSAVTALGIPGRARADGRWILGGGGG